MKRHFLLLVLSVFVSLFAVDAAAWETEAYTHTSRLASGRWMKVRVPYDGLYCIPASTLRSWGFADMSKVTVCGFGGRRLPQQLTKENYTDDLPELQTIVTDRGIVFYGLGAGRWTKGSEGEYFIQNDYSDFGFYYVGERTDGEGRPIAETDASQPVDNPATTFTERVHHELEQTSVPGEAGPLLLGEEFRFTPSRTITFATPGMKTGECNLVCTFVSQISGGGKLSFSVNGNALEQNRTDAVPAYNKNNYVHAQYSTAAHRFSAEGRERSEIHISLSASGTNNGAWLNFVSLNYTRALALPSSGHLVFRSGGPFAVSGVREGAVLLDVTSPGNLRRVVGNNANGILTAALQPGEYALFNPGAALPEPAAVGFVSNQNLHADYGIDMVIVAPQAFREQAERLADLHRNSCDTLVVKVVSPEQIYNEFSSGSPDPGAIRRYFKMLYDRGNTGEGRPLRYAVLMGRTSIDNRGLSAQAPSYPVIPSWMPEDQRASMSDNDGYCTDDITAMLEDGSGSDIGADKLSIAIGRIPALTAEEARLLVDKSLQYAEGARKTAWKHRFLFLADDENGGDHLDQTEKMVAECIATGRQQHMIRKIYLDAYPLVNNSVPAAREALFRCLDEGVVWWNFVGHANTTSWTSENILSYTDINNMYLRHWPFIYAATCDFLRLDGNTVTGGEILYKERFGGAIGIVSAVRPVYIPNNGLLTAAMGRALAKRDSRGRFLPPGEIYRLAKNDIRSRNGSPVADTNRLRFCFVGDPALRLATPSNIVRLDSIGNRSMTDTDAEPPVFSALGQEKVSGTVTDPDGNPLDGFNGVVLIEIFDSEKSVTTLGRGENGVNSVFEDYGDRVYCGSARVVGGRFSLTVAMPLEIAQNYRPGAMSLFAYSTDDDTEAVGLERGFYVYGYDDKAAPDETRPEIESFVLNHSSFRSGDTVNPSPMIIASVRDDVGLNVSAAGVGHQMTATLDGRTTFTDINFYFTPSDDGSASGIINYPLSGLSEGAHTLSLKIWDTAGNSASQEIEFYVQENLAPKIYEVYTDANPASTAANFYLSHDRPDNMVTVSVTVYNLLGRPVFSGSTTGRSDMSVSSPVTWNLQDLSGNRVPRGIYLYRATITTDGKIYETASRRIAVTAQ